MTSAARSESTLPNGVPGSGPSAAADPARSEELSAWMDGELDAAAGERRVDALLQDPHDRARYAAWCLVGDALRSHEVAAGHAPQLCARIHDALHAEPALLAPRALGKRRLATPIARHVASGAAIAAAAAVVVMVALPQLRASLGGATGPSAAMQAAAGAAGSPVTLAQQPGASAPSPRLDPYFQAHRDFGGGIMPAAAVYLRTGNEGEK